MGFRKYDWHSLHTCNLNLLTFASIQAIVNLIIYADSLRFTFFFSYFITKLKMIYTPVFKCFETKCRETLKSTIVPSGEKPLEETPQEASGEELSQCFYLLPRMKEYFREIMSIDLINIYV